MKPLTTEQVEKLLKGTEQEAIVLVSRSAADLEMKAVGKVLSSKNKTAIKNVVATLMDILQQVGDDEEGVAALRISAQGVQLEAGVRLGTFLRRAREAKGMLVSELVKMTSIDEGTYWRMESGYVRTPPPDDVLTQICSALGLNFEEMKHIAGLDLEQPADSYF